VRRNIESGFIVASARQKCSISDVGDSPADPFPAESERSDMSDTSDARHHDPYSSRPWRYNYPPHVRPEVPETEYSTLTAMFLDSVEKHATLPALESFGVEISYFALGEHAAAVSSWLRAQGLVKGDRVAIMSPNLATYPAVLFGVLLAGGVVVNVNPLYTPTELEHQLNDAEARFIFVLENFAHTVADAWPHMRLERAIVMKPGDLLGAKGVLINLVSRYVKRAVPAYDLPGATPMISVLREGRAKRFPAADIARDDIAFLQYTGGTTGVAKGAVLLHRNVAANVAQIVEWLTPFRTGQHKMVTALPLYHIFGLTACLLMMVRFGGCCLMIANPRDIADFTKTLKRSSFTMFSGVNTLYNALADNEAFTKLDFSKLVFCISGGMATQDVVARKWKRLTGKAIVEGYGLSETSPVVCVNPPLLDEFSGTIGYPVPSTEISIRTEDGEPAPFGERGELCVQGPQVMAGYWRRPDETQAATTADGYFRTGDIAVMQLDGEVKIVDRLKEMIIVSGFNVYPNEVENVLALHPKVREVAVIGAPDPHSGEAPVAFVVPREGDLTTDDLAAFAHESLTGYKRPRHYVFRDSLPKSAVGKILRRVLREEYVKSSL
jgi:long-chain acyl-CoA synthetase